MNAVDTNHLWQQDDIVLVESLSLIASQKISSLFCTMRKKRDCFFFFFVFKRLIQFPIINITTSLARFTLVWARILKGNSLLCPNKIANKEWSFNRPSYLLRFIGTAWNREGRTETVLQTTEGKKQLLRFF